MKTRAHVNSPPFLHPCFPPLSKIPFAETRKRGCTEIALPCSARRIRSLLPPSLVPHFFLSIFLPRSPRHAVSTPTRHDKGLCMNGIRRRIVTRHRVLLPPSLPPWEKSGGGEPKFSRISRLHRAAITFLPLARTSFYIDSIRCVYREQKRVERTSETWSNLLSRSFGWILDGSGEDEKRNIFPFFSIYLRHARGSYTLIN